MRRPRMALLWFAVLTHTGPVRVDLHALPSAVMVFGGSAIAFANGLLPCRAHWLLASLREARRCKRSESQPKSKCRDWRSQMFVDSDHDESSFFACVIEGMF